MRAAPARPLIYHITHVDNLASIAMDGLLADAALITRGGGARVPIGMSSIKRRRLTLPVACHPGDHVGDYVPFNFCPRSIMLFVVHRANHLELAYRGGQGPIVHLVAELRSVVTWADAQQRRWAFTLSNAGAAYAEVRRELAELDQVNWDAVEATDFRNAAIKEGKQAELLVHGAVPWDLIARIGVHSETVRAQVTAALARAPRCPPIDVRPDWYY